MSAAHGTRRQACEGKRPYTRKEAFAVTRERRALSPMYRAYKCPFCKAFHVGHLRPPKTQRRAG